MSENVKILKDLLDYVDEYTSANSKTSLKGFTLFLDEQVFGSAQKEKSFDKNNFMNYKTYPEVEFSELLSGLFRFARHYTKKALETGQIKTLDEFGFLATLLREKSLMKNELINMHTMEISSGSEIIKRLIRNGLLYEYPDETDKRGKRISLTEKGANAIMASFDSMHKASEIVIGNLTHEEINNTLKVFNKLTIFHHNIHKSDKKSSLEDITIKFLER